MVRVSGTHERWLAPCWICNCDTFTPRHRNNS